MINVTFKDSKSTKYEKGTSIEQIVSTLGHRLQKEALAASLNGKTVDLTKEIMQDSNLEILTFDDEGGRQALRHTTSHILAQAVKRLLPNVKLAIGPAIENGFYYDFDSEKPFTDTDLEQIEKEMQNIIKEDLKLERFELPRVEAIELMKEHGEDYKVELISDLPEDEIISFYKQGEFIDLCAGPHLISTGKVKAFKLTSVAGAYWRGNEKNKMLQRIYGTSFMKKSQLEEHLKMLEEAKENSGESLICTAY